MLTGNFTAKFVTKDIRTLQSGNCFYRRFAVFYVFLDNVVFFVCLSNEKLLYHLAPGKVVEFTVTQDDNVTVPTNVHVTWLPPQKRDLNGIIEKYFIRYRTSPSDEKVECPFNKGYHDKQITNFI